MKRVLIIGNFWPYLPSNRGAGRIIELADTLPKLGWQPVILTQPLTEKAPSGKFQIVEVPYPGDIFEFWRKIIRRLIGASPKVSLKGQVKQVLGNTGKKNFLDFVFNLYQEFFGYPDTEKSWAGPAFERAELLVAKGDIDAVISEYPFISHIVARGISKKYGIPWIADFCDLWSQNHMYLFGPVRKYFDKRLEKITLESAAAIVTVSQPLVEILKELHGDSGNIYSIPHGFDSEIISDSSTPLTEKFTITYTGRIYSERENPQPFFAAVSELVDSGQVDPLKLQIKFYGDKDAWVVEMASKHGLGDVCFFYDRLPKIGIIEEQRSSQVLLLFAVEGESGKGCYTLKIYDYLAAKRPIVVIGGMPGDVLGGLISETDSGKRGRTVGEIKEIIKNYYDEYVATGSSIYRGNQDIIANYSYAAVAEKFVLILNRISAGESNPSKPKSGENKDNEKRYEK